MSEPDFIGTVLDAFQVQLEPVTFNGKPIIWDA